jgi:hypothetical protein
MPKYFTNSPPMAKAISPKQDKIGGLTLLFNKGFCNVVRETE